MGNKTEIWQGTLALMILKTIEALGPLHGYGIARRIDPDQHVRIQAGSGRDRHEVPHRAVPPFDEGIILRRRPASIVADRPDIVRVGRRHVLQVMKVAADQRHVNVRPA